MTYIHTHMRTYIYTPPLTTLSTRYYALNRRSSDSALCPGSTLRGWPVSASVLARRDGAATVAVGGAYKVLSHNWLGPIVRHVPTACDCSWDWSQQVVPVVGESRAIAVRQENPTISYDNEGPPGICSQTIARASHDK